MAVVPVCYFGDFELDRNDRWVWRYTSGIPSAIAIFVKKSTSYAGMYHDLQNKLNVESSQYNMKLRFVFNGNSSIPISPVNVTSDVEVNYLLELNKMDTTPLCVTLVRKDIVNGEHENLDGANNNVNAPKDDVVILETVAPYRDLTVTNKISSVVQDNENENEFTNEDLIALSHQRLERGGSSGAGLSGPSSNSSRVVPDDEDLRVEQLFETKKDLQKSLHRMTLKYNFQFKVKNSSKSLLTVVCVDDNCCWRLRATKMNTNEMFVVRKYIRGHTCRLLSGRSRTYRVSSTGEVPRPRRCGKCRAIGHTRQFCTSKIPPNDN